MELNTFRENIKVVPNALIIGCLVDAYMDSHSALNAFFYNEEKSLTACLEMDSANKGQVDKKDADELTQDMMLRELFKKNNGKEAYLALNAATKSMLGKKEYESVKNALKKKDKVIYSTSGLDENLLKSNQHEFMIKVRPGDFFKTISKLLKALDVAHLDDVQIVTPPPRFICAGYTAPITVRSSTNDLAKTIKMLETLDRSIGKSALKLPAIYDIAGSWFGYQQYDFYGQSATDLFAKVLYEVIKDVAIYLVDNDILEGAKGKRQSYKEFYETSSNKYSAIREILRDARLLGIDIISVIESQLKSKCDEFHIDYSDALSFPLVTSVMRFIYGDIQSKKELPEEKIEALDDMNLDESNNFLLENLEIEVPYITSEVAQVETLDDMNLDESNNSLLENFEMELPNIKIEATQGQTLNNVSLDEFNKPLSENLEINVPNFTSEVVQVEPLEPQFEKTAYFEKMESEILKSDSKEQQSSEETAKTQERFQNLKEKLENWTRAINQENEELQAKDTRRFGLLKERSKKLDSSSESQSEIDNDLDTLFKEGVYDHTNLDQKKYANYDYLNSIAADYDRAHALHYVDDDINYLLDQVEKSHDMVLPPDYEIPQVKDERLKSLEHSFDMAIEALIAAEEAELKREGNSTIPSVESLKIDDELESLELPSFEIHNLEDGLLIPDLSDVAYTGSSLKEALETGGYYTDFYYIKSLADHFGIENYTGSKEQDAKLLSILRQPTHMDEQEDKITRSGDFTNKDNVIIPDLKAVAYTGSSLTKALRTGGYFSDPAYIRALADHFKIENYVGSKEQDAMILDNLRHPENFNENGERLASNLGIENNVSSKNQNMTLLDNLGRAANLDENGSKEPTFKESVDPAYYEALKSKYRSYFDNLDTLEKPIKFYDNTIIEYLEYYNVSDVIRPDYRIVLHDNNMIISGREFVNTYLVFYLTEYGWDEIDNILKAYAEQILPPDIKPVML